MHKLIFMIEDIKNDIVDFLIHIKNKFNNLNKAAKITISVIIGAVICSLIFFTILKLFFSDKLIAPSKTEAISVKVQRIAKENFTDEYTVMGTIKGAIENELRFEIDGVLSSYNFTEGSRIVKGQIICSLDPKDAFTKVDFSRSKYSGEKSVYFSASQRLKVYEDLFRMKAISESKLLESRYETLSAESRMKATLSELELAQSNLAKTSLIAPSNGLLAEILIKSGDYVTPQDVVAKYISGIKTNFEVDIPEKDVNKVIIGQKVKINCDSYADKDFWGKVLEIAPTVKERTRTSTIKIEIENNDRFLRSGMFGRGSIYLTEIIDAFIVPNGSIVALGESTFLVPLVIADPKYPGEGIIEMRKVTPGIKLSQRTIIDDGLLPSELLVIETQGQLLEGIRVKFTEEESKSKATQLN